MPCQVPAPGPSPERNVTLNLLVASVAAVTPAIRQVELTNVEGGALPAFTAGAHIDLALGNGLERSFSLLNDPIETHRYVIAVLREADSRGGSVWVHDHLRQGERLTSSEPINNFPLNEAGEAHILIAGGIGITPLKAMAHRLIAQGANFTLHYCARDEERAAYLSELRALLGDRVHVHLDGGDIARGLDVRALPAGRPCLCLWAGGAHPGGARGVARLAEGLSPLRAVSRLGGRHCAAQHRSSVRDQARAGGQDIDR